MTPEEEKRTAHRGRYQRIEHAAGEIAKSAVAGAVYGADEWERIARLAARILTLTSERE